MGLHHTEQPITLHFIRWLHRCSRITADLPTPDCCLCPALLAVWYLGGDQFITEHHLSQQRQFQSALNHLVLLDVYLSHMNPCSSYASNLKSYFLHTISAQLFFPPPPHLSNVCFLIKSDLCKCWQCCCSSASKLCTRWFTHLTNNDTMSSATERV